MDKSDVLEGLLKEACKVLGWQGGTIHQVLRVLSSAKFIVDSYKEATISGEWENVRRAIARLNADIYN